MIVQVIFIRAAFELTNKLREAIFIFLAEEFLRGASVRSRETDSKGIFEFPSLTILVKRVLKTIIKAIGPFGKDFE